MGAAILLYEQPQVPKKSEYQELGEMLEKAINRLPYSRMSSEMVLNDFIMKSEKKGFTKPFGAKSKAFFKDKVLTIKVSDKDYCFYKMPEFSRAGYGIFFIQLKEVPTERGLHYVVIQKPTQHEVFFSSHFIDRYKERMNLKMGRMDVVAFMIKDILRTGILNEKEIKRNGSLLDHKIEMYLEQGMGMGRRWEMPNGWTRDYIQTYVNLDMMFPDQLERHAEAFQNMSKEVS